MVVDIGRVSRVALGATLSLTLMLGFHQGMARAQLPLEPPEEIQETLSEQLGEPSEVQTKVVEPAVDAIAEATGDADPTEAVVGASPSPTARGSPSQTAPAVGDGRGERVEQSGQRAPTARPDQRAAGRRGKAAPPPVAGRALTPAQATGCPREDGRWVVAQGQPFGGQWEGTPAAGILVFSSTGEEVRFDLIERFRLEDVCWQTSNGVRGSDARLQRIDPDTYAVTVHDPSLAMLEELTFSVDPPLGPEADEEVLGLVIRRDLAKTGLRLLGLGGLALLLLLSGAALLRLGRRHPSHAPIRST